MTMTEGTPTHPVHPWYGPCDAIAPGPMCAECLKEIERLREALHNMVALAEPHFTDASQRLAIEQARTALGDSQNE